MNEQLRPAQPNAYDQHRPAQRRKRRPRGIQIAEPSAQGGGIRHAIRVFDGRCGVFPATAFQEVPLERLAASNEAVMAVRRRKRRQEGECLTAAVAKTAANSDPIVVLIMSLFAPAPMTDDGILHANRAAARNDSRARIGPIRFEVVLRGRKLDKQYRDRGAPLATLAFPKIRTRGRDLHLPSKIPTGKE